MEILKKFKALQRIFLVSFQSQTADRARTIIWSLQDVVIAFVSGAAWIFLSFGGANPQVDTDKLIVYYFVLFVLWCITAGHLGGSIASDIKSGKLSAGLLKPIHPLTKNVLNEQAWKANSVIFTIPAFFFLIFLMGKGNILLAATPNVPYFLLTLVLGAIIWIELELLIGLSAFWLTKVGGVYNASNVINALWGAQIAPMAMLPLFIQNTAFYLPFRFYFSFPADTLLNVFQLHVFWESIGIGLVWVVVLGLFVKMMYKFGLKKYESLGI